MTCKECECEMKNIVTFWPWVLLDCQNQYARHAKWYLFYRYKILRKLFLGTFLLALTGALIVMMCQYRSIATFSVFTQPIDAIDVTRVTLSCLNNIINAIDVTMSNTECQMSNVK